MGLAAPQITYVVHELREHGVEIADDLTTVAENPGCYIGGAETTETLTERRQ